ALIAGALLSGERLRHPPLVTLVLPFVEPALHGDDVGVAELVQGLRRERRPVSSRALDDEGRGMVGDAGLDVRLELTPRDVQSARNRALFVLVRLADVEPHSTGLLAQLVGFGRVDLADL